MHLAPLVKIDVDSLSCVVACGKANALLVGSHLTHSLSLSSNPPCKQHVRETTDDKRLPGSFSWLCRNPHSRVVRVGRELIKIKIITSGPIHGHRTLANRKSCSMHAATLTLVRIGFVVPGSHDT